MTADLRHDLTCPTCFAEKPSARYCAPGRCYCGHEACPAFLSWVDMSKVGFAPDPPPTNRERAKGGRKRARR